MIRTDSPLFCTFIENVKAIRGEKGLTMEVVAERMGIKHTGYHKIESGQRMVRIDTLEKLASALGVEAVELLTPRRTKTKRPRRRSATANTSNLCGVPR